MKIPQSPPESFSLWRDLEGERVLQLVQAQKEGPLARGRYVHWDKLRRFPLPEGWDHRIWWAGLKLARQAGRRSVGLNDPGGRPFSFILADPLPEQMHQIDSGARGVIGSPEAVTNPATRDQYLVRSMIEESLTSSMLEGALSTRDAAKKMIREDRPPRDHSERMILNNYRTMERIRGLRTETLSRDLVCEVQRIVTDGTLANPTGAGRFRRDDESIHVGDETGVIFHTPPPAQSLEDRMARMCEFANGQTPQGFVHPLIRSIILHFWLAYDHPFVDGNGRTARALFYWSMLRHQYWLIEFVSISRIILKAPVQYGRAFLHTETDDNDLTYFLLYHAEVVRRAVEDLHAYIERRSRRLRQAEAELRQLRDLNSRQRDLVSHALRHPDEDYTIEGHRSSHGTVQQTARTDLLDLVDRGLFTRTKIGRVWHFRAVADLENRLR